MHTKNHKKSLQSHKKKSVVVSLPGTRKLYKFICPGKAFNAQKAQRFR